MAWTTPITWKTGTLANATLFNAHIRGNFGELVLHTHSGGSGSGTATLGNLTMVTLIDATVPAAPGGTLTRIYTTATALHVRAASGADRIISEDGHTHGH